ncbi:MAG: phospolipase D nuclease N-terminal domain protein [Idiomarinaceae bacterium HL-53]|nr:MAG: phospolipase D nuclease N-terminal domain protein [Idiomarinaceae bacterium HL-53]CUS47459.1 Phospholipase_D-nuclease N-terminal [Idiomarinaceae bacterium HL-53]
MFELSGFLGLIILILDVYAIVKTVQSGAGTGSKVLWIVLIILLPVLGFILWLLLGPKSQRI